MAMWLYQLSEGAWSSNNYRLDIWEGERWRWPAGSGATATSHPTPGDTIVFFYARTGIKEPGFYGWAVVTLWDDKGPASGVYFRPVAPSDQLKMRPWWGGRAHRLADAIRVPIKQRTLFSVPHKLAAEIGEGIHAWVGGGVDPLSPGVESGLEDPTPDPS